MEEIHQNESNATIQNVQSIDDGIHGRCTKK